MFTPIYPPIQYLTNKNKNKNFPLILLFNLVFWKKNKFDI